MSIQRLALTQFKNHPTRALEPAAKWNIITGLNGQGKTNVLDSIYMLCVLKSFLGQSMEGCITYGLDFFRLDATMTSDDRVEITYPKGGTRKVRLNGKNIAKPTDYIGRHPVMIIQPIDDYKLLEGSKARRRIMDQAISQFDGHYLQALMQWNRLLKQRNALLKRMRTQGTSNHDQLHIYTPQLVACCRTLYEGRKDLIETIREDLMAFYSQISGNQELPEVSYMADALPEQYEMILHQNTSIDIAAGRTTRGPHLDDMNMILDGHALKSAGSQGQRKSFLVAIKLAIYQLMATNSGKLPILLLDDLFDKLDNERVRRLLTVLNETSFGQIFITDKDDAHLKDIFATLGYPLNHVML